MQFQKLLSFYLKHMGNVVGKEHAIVVPNHRSDIDWLAGCVIAQRSDCLGSLLAVMKKSTKFLPVIGWSIWFAEYLFIDRIWAKDETTLKDALLDKHKSEGTFGCEQKQLGRPLKSLLVSH
ncbi:hypothetical protein B296_00015539 [Ensete ventricosum]|uniref:Phospholipid/glycerol acyltransferase domain-containing protein n=1 Tax=Ensete ventricosum TaxID=4639 RepID=A0A427AR34_ENSVE|nr:hypothetical protein B296_00015539 [Ensete ventricosum]